MILADERREAKREAKKWAEEQKYEEEAWKRQEKFLLETYVEEAPIEKKKPVHRKSKLKTEINDKNILVLKNGRANALQQA
jgi:hypothetical protein